jgi:hypothetical protein
MRDLTTPLRVEYRLTEADVHLYCSSGLAGKCWRSCRRRKTAIVLLIALGCFLVGTCFRTHGLRAGGLALGTTLVVVAALAWGREIWFERCVDRLAGQMGLPRDLRLVVTPEGIVEESGTEIDDTGRTFAWSEVVEVSRIDHLTVIHLRPAGGVLIVPDSAFSSPEERTEFETTIQAFRKSGRSISLGRAQQRPPV